MSLFDVFKTKTPNYKTGTPYDIIGGDHFKHVQARLDEQGLSADFEIVLPKSNQLQIDYDRPELPEQFELALGLLVQAFCNPQQFLTYAVRVSKSGNRHVTIDLPRDVGLMERIAWQSIFGSDPMREGLSAMSVTRGLKNPTLLIEWKNRPPIMTGVKTLPIEPPVGRKFR
jgi:hypothetical protein